MLSSEASMIESIGGSVGTKMYVNLLPSRIRIRGLLGPRASRIESIGRAAATKKYVNLLSPGFEASLPSKLPGFEVC